MKILHIISGISGGGRERRMGQIAIDMQSRNIAEVHIIYFKDSVNNYHEIENKGVKLHLIETKSKKDLVIKLYNQIKEIKADIVQVWTEIPIILLTVSFAKLILKFKLIIGFIADGNKLQGIHTRIAARLSYWSSDAILSNSYAGLVAKDAICNKSYVIYNGFNFDRLKGLNINKEQFHNEIGVSTKYIACMVARFSNAKNWDMFLNVAQEVQTQRQDVTFIAVGTGELLEKYKDEALNREISNVKFLGYRSDVERILQVCDVSLLFSNSHVHAEGVSNTIMESMAASKVVIATKGGGTGEIIENYHNGFIIEPDDTVTAVKHICNILNDVKLRKSIEERAFNTIKTKFLQKDKTEEYITLYKSI